jgi:hypothetical protein
MIPILAGCIAGFIFFGSCSRACAEAPAHEPTTRDKKLIQYGWDTPDTAYLRKHLKRMEESSPFDGLVIAARALAGEGKLGGTDSLAWTAFQRKRFTPDNYEHAIADLKASTSKKFTDNFLALISQTDMDFDWFDDAAWADVMHNIRIMARVAKAGHCVGLMFDPEEYAGPIWSYGRMPELTRAKHTYDAYVAKVRQRGEEFGKAIHSEFSDAKILTLFGPFLYAQNVNWIGRERTAEANYNLLGPFYDGMLGAAGEKMTLIDGYEQSYGFTSEQQFQAGRRDVLVEARAHSAAPEAFDKHVQVGFGLWLDNQSAAKGGWFPDEPAKNHFTPEQWQASVHLALKHSDRYVWVYNERALWWDKGPGEAYVKAMTNARHGAAAAN